MIITPFAYMATKAAFILDIYTGAAAAYSLRKLSSSATSAIEVTRTSDSATQDIGFVGEDLDTASLSSFIGANTGVISKWYDQSGNGDTMTQATQTKMPIIVDSGTLVTTGGLPAAKFDGSDDSFIGTNNNPLSYNSAFSAIFVSYKNSTAYKSYETILAGGATGVGATNNYKCWALTYPVSGQYVGTDIWAPAGVRSTAGVTTNQRHLYGVYISDWATHITTGTSHLRLNGSDTTPVAYGVHSPASPMHTNPMQLGVFDAIVLGSSFFAGNIQEVILWDSDKDSDRVAIETNVNDYWGVY